MRESFRGSASRVAAVAMIAAAGLTACASAERHAAAPEPTRASSAGQGAASAEVALSKLPLPVAKPARPVRLTPLPPEPAPPSPTPPVPSTPPPAPAPMLQAKQLIGLDRTRLAQLLGPPPGIREAAPATVWEYGDGDCRLSVFFYPDVRTRDYRALSVEMHGGDKSAAAEGACLERLKRLRPRP